VKPVWQRLIEFADKIMFKCSRMSPGVYSMNVHMLWVEGDLTRFERASVTSFIRAGFNPIIWTYSSTINSWDLVELRDAREILDKSHIFYNKCGSYASFSDYFSYKVLNKFGGIYSDIDVIALQADTIRLPDYFIASQLRSNLEEIEICVNLISNKQPREGNLIDIASLEAELFPKEAVIWDELGVRLLQSIIDRDGIGEFTIVEPAFSNIFHWWEQPRVMLSEGFIPNVPFVHLYSTMWVRSGFSKNEKFPRQSIIEKILRSVD
jgi:hypothetical protein